MKQDALEIVKMLIVDVAPEMAELAETAQLGDEIGNIFGIIKYAIMLQRVLAAGQRVASRIQARRRSQQAHYDG